MDRRHRAHPAAWRLDELAGRGGADDRVARAEKGREGEEGSEREERGERECLAKGA